MKLRFCLFRPFLALATLALAACHKSETAEHAGPEPKVANDRVTLPDKSPALASLKAAPVQPGGQNRARLTGRVMWDDDITVRVFAPFAGRVEKMLADVSQHVNEGDTLALIASPDYAQAQADAGKATADTALAERNYERLKTLFDHGAAAEKDMQAAEADLARARAEKSRAENTLRMRAGPAAAEAGGENLFPLKAPVAGLIVERNINPGQEVRPDQMLANAPQFFAPLFVVSDPTRLWVMIDATERDLPGLHKGTAVTVHAPAYPERTFNGEVEWVADALDPATRRVRVRARVDNTGRELKAEMFVTVEFATAGPSVLEAPATAVFMKGERHYVYIEEKPGTYLRREVQIGAQHDDKLQVTQGVQAGERVVIEGSLLLDEIFADASGS